ncbi:MAG TPA: cysteine--tRNA ligase [Bacteroidales bacterium]|jgi:cysteinyl-tRNA synthetase|nr:cysteine--tRNA ligase [Bacteroidales bacterium]HOS57218.1 cysteine--tRNA ligase [Bacteroidales bacterium]HRR03899.1 cysteine--tRNA ligase [Bacteroidales bacterium]HXK73907.1 cysteine--tRNA ligase [Bacteroidales bacterium]
MKNKLVVHNTLTKKKELFTPIHKDYVGLYVCGPTVYGEPHLGHARPAVTFDLIFRYLQHLGYKVRYVRNITDVGHLENDADEGEDKIAKKARLEQLEPMEVAQFYIDSYHIAMDMLNVKRPSIEPRASGHIIEQIEMIQKILDKGYAYVSEGSVYFDVEKFDKNYGYGKLSGRVLEELFSNTRTLDGQDEKRNPADFALWKKATPEHIMKWSSPWSVGFPGWHIECTAMSTKYLGEHFDIHGGGMDLLFPHHESEICQSTIANGVESVKYWLHNNMITINGQKMGKSLGNFITLNEFFTGNHALLEKKYSPMTIRFFLLQAHYRGTLDFSNEALIAAEKGMNKLYAAFETLSRLKINDTPTEKAHLDWVERCYEAMNDDFNSPKVIAELFEATRLINLAQQGAIHFNHEEITEFKRNFELFFFDILGMKRENAENNNQDLVEQLMQLILQIRQQAKTDKNWEIADAIRQQLNTIGITVKDTKEGATWEKDVN